jgi:hypothetical protein
MALIVGALALVLEDLYLFCNGNASALGDLIKYLNSGTVAADLLKTAFYALGGILASFLTVKFVAFMIPLARVIWAYGVLGTAAIVNGAKMAASWLVAMWPIALLIAAIVGIGVVIWALATKFDQITAWIGDMFESAANSVLEYWKPVKTWFDDFFGWFGAKYEAVKGFASNLIGGSTEVDANGNSTGVSTDGVTPASISGITPASMVGGNGGGSVNTVNKNTTVNLTVPAGTSQEQAAFLQKAAQETFKTEGGNPMEFSIYAQ